MGLINTLKEKLPFGGKPESDLTIDDFEDEEHSSNENNSGEQEDGENDSEEEQSGEGSGEQEDHEDGSEEEQSGEDSEEQEDGEGGSESEQSGGDSGEQGESDKSSELEELKDKMDKNSSERDMTDWYDTNVDYEKPTQFVEDHFETLQDMRAEPSTEISIRQNERDKRIENVRNSVDSSTIIEKYEKRFSDEIREAFRKIKTREAPKPAEYGQRINVRGVIRKRSGDPTEERLYLEMDQSEVGDRCITVVVDCSGSMDETEIKLALMALADACEQIGDRFTATAYSTDRCRRSNPGLKTDLITAPTEPFKPEHLDSFRAHGYTPTSSGINDGRALADITPNSEDVLIVITDGVANVDMDSNHYSGGVNNPAMVESNEQFQAAINEGKRVIGVGVGEYLDDNAMNKIFGDSYIRTDMNKIADSLVEIYRGQMRTIN